MPLDGIVISFLAKELHNQLHGARVDRIAQTDPYDIWIKFRSKGPWSQLVISANPSNPRIHLTQEKKSTSCFLRFGSLLRKHLHNACVISISSSHYERVICIQFQCMDDMGDLTEKNLIVEIMGRHSNIILINKKQTILDAILHIDNQTSSVREVLPARTYTSPPSQNKISIDELSQRLDQHTFFPSHFNGNIGQFLLHHIKGISPPMVSSICAFSQISDKDPYSGMSDEIVERLTYSLRDFVYQVLHPKGLGYLFYENHDLLNPLDFHALRLHQYANFSISNHLSEAIDAYYQRKQKRNDWLQRKNGLTRSVDHEINANEKKLSHQQTELDECKNTELFKKYGDLILSNKNNIYPKACSVSVSDYYAVPPVMIDIPLNPSLSASKNATWYYSQYKKLRSREFTLTRLMADNQKTSVYLRSLSIALENAESDDDLEALESEIALILRKNTPIKTNKQQISQHSSTAKKERKYYKYRTFKSADGTEILIGRNNLQNDQLSLKFADKNDFWFHLQKSPGAHAILKVKDHTTPSDLAFIQAAMLTAWYSKDRTRDNTGSGKVNVDYCLVKDIWKPKGSPPGFVLYRNFKTLYVPELIPEGVLMV